MRLSTEAERDEERAIATVRAALEAGVSVFDTAHAYAWSDEELGHGERLLVRALDGHPAARVVTKGGMARPDGAWQPDGRAKRLLRDCEESLEALGGRAIDLYLLHAPDPRTTWATSVRALGSLVDRGLVKRVGVCNVNRRQLTEAMDLAPIAAVQVALGAGDDQALRGGVVRLAAERGLWILAHSPFGGPKRAARLGRDPVIAKLAQRRGMEPAQVVLAWLLALHPRVVALPGARRPESARSAASAARLELSTEDRALLDEHLGQLAAPVTTRPRAGTEVVLVAGISGAGKSTRVGPLVEAGYQRLNRDERGGTLAGIAAALDERLARGVERAVLDNTYVTRASRYDVLRVAARHQVPVRCVWLDTPLPEAQRNLVERMLAAHGRLLEPDEVARGATRDDPTRLSPRVPLSQLRDLEAPEREEGFASIEVVPFTRAPSAYAGAGLAIALEALLAAGPSLLERAAGPTLVFAWLPDDDAALRDATRGLDVELAACTHPAGPPSCWCRPPLPGLLLAFARRHQIDPARLTVVGTTDAHRKLAEAAGALFRSP
jgi:aryl-alcohol dehydrogenase-like predicted oxidoreductase/predicted kinase